MKGLTLFSLTLAACLVSSSVWAASVTIDITAGANTTAHRIEKQTDGGAYATLQTVTMPVVQYIDTAVSAGHQYCYRAYGVAALGESTPSQPCCSALFVGGTPTLSCTVNP